MTVHMHHAILILYEYCMMHMNCENCNRKKEESKIHDNKKNIASTCRRSELGISAAEFEAHLMMYSCNIEGQIAGDRPGDLWTLLLSTGQINHTAYAHRTLLVNRYLTAGRLGFVSL